MAVRRSPGEVGSPEFAYPQESCPERPVEGPEIDPAADRRLSGSVFSSDRRKKSATIRPACAVSRASRGGVEGPTMKSGAGGAAIRQIGQLFEGGTVAGLGEVQLLDRFVAR